MLNLCRTEMCLKKRRTNRTVLPLHEFQSGGYIKCALKDLFRFTFIRFFFMLPGLISIKVNALDISSH